MEGQNKLGFFSQKESLILPLQIYVNYAHKCPYQKKSGDQIPTKPASTNR